MSFAGEDADANSHSRLAPIRIRRLRHTARKSFMTYKCNRTRPRNVCRCFRWKMGVFPDSGDTRNTRVSAFRPSRRQSPTSGPFIGATWKTMLHCVWPRFCSICPWFDSASRNKSWDTSVNTGLTCTGNLLYGSSGLRCQCVPPLAPRASLRAASLTRRDSIAGKTSHCRRLARSCHAT